MSKRIKVPQDTGGVVSFHFDQVNPIGTYEVVDGHIEVPDEVADQLDEAHRALGFEVVEG